MKKISVCDLCGSSGLVPILSNIDRMQGAPGVFNLLKCRNCGLFRHSPQIELKEINEYYPPKTYYSLKVSQEKKTFIKKLGDHLYQVYFGEKQTFWRKFVFFPLRPLISTLPVVRKGRFLEVGCGAGDFLLRVKNLDMEVCGVEPGGFEPSFTQKLGLKIYNCDLKTCNFPKDYFDVIYLNHVFEHLADPTEHLRELKRILKPGGKLVIAVPNIDSLAFRIFGKYWSYLDTPRHLYLFSSSTMKAYAKKTGLHINKLRYNSTPFQFFGSIFYLFNGVFRKNKYLKDSRLINRMMKGQSLWLIVLFNLPWLPLVYFLNLIHQGDAFEVLMNKED
ncbi:MAG: class I SAM-dependent methyltransferase [Patescibacteria group bacterium]